ncbi:CT20-domain-containing protein [Pleomassaria siparia CBS 279.74]|uniref:CT20-domain-containing protein n=1 Tax=Pleomassaria siparia CBS 279.74 TaxID=1314801 RepID=A0A6G1KL17_9PLEO|nr:CT20-domain-containing protein [Pleomassaria siparia CBS 279.74]
MPPRKRAKASAASTPLADTQPRTPQDSGVVAQSQNQTSPQDENLLNDPWNDDEEIELFKSMMRTKPTGLHKHFRMISIHSNLRSHGFVNEETPHTRTAGIWRKLETLFDLQALDEREIAHAFANDPDPFDPKEADQIPDFELPEEDFGELMWKQRFPDSKSVSSSPALIPTEDDKELYFPGFGLLQDLPEGAKSQKTESVVDASPPKNTKNTRASRTAAKSGKAKAGQTAKHSKAQSVEEESADEEEESGDEQEDSAESEEVTAPSTRRTNRGSGQVRPVAKRTRKR